MAADQSDTELEIVDDKNLACTLEENNSLKDEIIGDSTVFGFQIHHLSSTTQFLIISSSVVICFLSYSYIQELMFQLEGFKPYGMYLTLMQFILYSAFAAVERFIRKHEARKIPMKTFAVLSFLTVASTGLSNSAVGYLNYPTQVVFKCCNLILVLIGGIFIQKKTYGPLYFIAAAFMSVGLIFFILTDSQISPNFNLTGVALIVGALCADAAIVNVEEQTMKTYAASTVEMVYYSYLIGCAYLLIGLILIGQLAPAFLFCSLHPQETYGYGAAFAFTGYCGIQLILTLVRTNGAFVTVIVAACRKAVTIVLSFLLFAKPFSFQYLWSGMIVGIGIYLSMIAKDPPSLRTCTCMLKCWLSNFRSRFHREFQRVSSTV